MKLQCHRPSLLEAFQIVDGVVPARTPRDILKNVKLQASDSSAVLIGTDSEVGIRYEIPGVEIASSGETLLPTKRVLAILRELRDEAVALHLDGEAVVVRGEHSDFRLSVEDPAEFPTVAAFDEKSYLAISGAAFREAIRRTIFATDPETTRYALGGVLLDLESKDALSLVATDSRRLALIRIGCERRNLETPENPKPVVPAKAMQLIERSMSDEDEEVLLAVHANDVLVKSGNSTIYSRLVEGRFPRYGDVIPKQLNMTI
ncbi:MAG: DNA polymerase III subunit beta, partial [Planctomycetaceae bacterium]